MPGYPTPRPEIQQRQAAPKPTPPVRMRLGWSRGIVDGARELSAPAEMQTRVPNVRSTAALRARAGEPQPRVVLPEPQPVVEIKRVAPPRRIPVPQWEPEPPMVKPPSFFATAWGAIRDLVHSIPRASQISD